MNKKYYFSDFTEDNYKHLLEIAVENYQFAGFDLNKISTSNDRLILWRHDVDYSLNRAFALSEIEHSMGVKTTYFIHLHSSMYNPFEKQQTALINKIIKNGHSIGLHFDFDFYNSLENTANLQGAVDLADFERKILQNFLGVNIDCVSFHNPEASKVLDIDGDYYAGMVNAYAKSIKDKFKYCSDSNGYWRFDRLEDVLKGDYANVQVLTHPTWWTKNIMSPYDRIVRCVEGRKNKNMMDYNNFLKDCGRENVGKPE